MADLAASIAHKLLNHAKDTGQDYNAVLTRYGLERLLYRLSTSRHANSFLLKGALLFLLWHELPNRPTRDIDLLGFGADDIESIENVFRDLCGIDGADGVVFDPASVKGETIRKQTGYGGVRVSMMGRLKTARLPIQIDVGFGDVVTPKPTLEVFPVVLGALPAPQLRVYPKYTVCAEKVQAMATLGMTNTRLKDYYDVWLLLEEDKLDPKILGEAIQATFRRRGTPVFEQWPAGFTDEFSLDLSRRSLWSAFLKKNALDAPSLNETVNRLRVHLSVPMDLARAYEI
jgi:predicted nucleotidyltransferase component of viral defense system